MCPAHLVVCMQMPSLWAALCINALLLMAPATAFCDLGDVGQAHRRQEGEEATAAAGVCPELRHRAEDGDE